MSFYCILTPTLNSTTLKCYQDTQVLVDVVLPHALTHYSVCDATLIALSSQESLYLFSIPLMSIIHSYPITSACSDLILVSNDRLYCALDHQILILNHQLQLLHSFNNATKDISKIALDPSQKILAVASHAIQLYSLANDFKLLHTFPGHSNNVIWIQFLSTDLLVSLADQERSLSLWNTQNLNLQGLLSADQSLIRASVADDKALAVDEQGLVHFWSLGSALLEKPLKKKKAFKSKTIATCGLLKIMNEKDPLEILPILDAWFVDEYVSVCRGSFVMPVFERLQYLDSNGDIQSESLFSRKKQDLNLSASLQESREKFDVIVKSTQEEIVSVPMDKNAPTLEEKLEQTSLVEEKPKFLFTSVASLHQMLSQSIVSLDSEMFERCLMVRDQKLIRQTVQRLSSPLVVDFLNQILVRLSEKPKRATHLIEWIRASLMFHSSYLMSLPELSSTLASLYRHLEQRVGFYEKLMKVSGKLDMILCQSNAREEQESQEAMQTYDEEKDESDNESMDESEGSLMSTEDTESQESEEEEEEAGDSE